jgi:hypothetical protein
MPGARPGDTRVSHTCRRKRTKPGFQIVLKSYPKAYAYTQTNIVVSSLSWLPTLGCPTASGRCALAEAALETTPFLVHPCHPCKRSSRTCRLFSSIITLQKCILLQALEVLLAVLETNPSTPLSLTKGALFSLPALCSPASSQHTQACPVHPAAAYTAAATSTSPHTTACLLKHPTTSLGSPCRC